MVERVIIDEMISLFVFFVDVQNMSLIDPITNQICTILEEAVCFPYSSHTGQNFDNWFVAVMVELRGV